MKEEIQKIVKELLDKDIQEGPLELDSIDFLDVVIRVEDVYNIKIDTARLSKKTTLEEFTHLVESLVSKD